MQPTEAPVDNSVKVLQILFSEQQTAENQLMYRESEEEKSKRNALNKTQCARQRWDYFDLSSVTTSQ